MARKTIVTLVDDLDGSEASETVQFALDGVAYQIDLSSLNAGRLRDELTEYVARARRPGGTRPTTSGASARVGRPTSTDNVRQPVSGQRSPSPARSVSKPRAVTKAADAAPRAAEDGRTADAARDAAPAAAAPSDAGTGTAKVGRPPVVSLFKPAPAEEQQAPEPAPAKPAKGAVPTVTFKAAK